MWNSINNNKDIVQIYYYHPFGDQIFKNCVHHCLEGGRAVGQSKEHHKWLIKASVGLEGCFSFVSVFHSDIVESPTYVQLSEVLSSLQLINLLMSLEMSESGYLFLTVTAFKAW